MPVVQESYTHGQKSMLRVLREWLAAVSAKPESRFLNTHSNQLPVLDIF
jgi:hypothetical protein